MIGVLISRLPGRFGREQVDWPLALASIDLPVRLFLSGTALAALPEGESGPPAPQWQRLWAAAAELGVEIFLSAEDCREWGLKPQRLAFRARMLPRRELLQLQADCRHLVHV